MHNRGRSRAVTTHQISIVQTVAQQIEGGAYLNDRHHEAGRVRELAHIYLKVIQFIPPRLLKHNTTSLPHGANAPQIPRGINMWIWGFRQGDLGNGGRDGHLGEAWGCGGFEG